MTQARSLERTLAMRVVAVLAIGLLLVTGVVVGALALHLRGATLDDLDAAVAAIERADSESTTIDESRVFRVVPSGGVLALIAEDGSITAVAPESLDISGLPVDAVPGSDIRFTSGDRSYVARVVETDGLSLTDRSGVRIDVTRVLVAANVTSDRATVARVSVIALAVAVIAAAALALVARAVVRRSLAPVRAMTEASSRIARTGVPEPLPDGGPYLETRVLAASVDDALRRRTDAERAVRDFVADASHELRTPVAKVQGWGEVALHADPSDPRARHALERVVGAAEELAVIVDELSLLARLDAGPRVAHDAVDLAELIREVAADATVVAPGATVTCVVEPPQSTVEGDAGSLRRALRNLVGNAVQHGGGRVTVTLAARDGGIAVDVADEGPGVPTDMQGRVFDRFFSSRPGNPRHSGLGLAIVSAIAHAHGGHVALLDHSPGATFRLWLPGTHRSD